MPSSQVSTTVRCSTLHVAPDAGSGILSTSIRSEEVWCTPTILCSSLTQQVKDEECSKSVRSTDSDICEISAAFIMASQDARDRTPGGARSVMHAFHSDADTPFSPYSQIGDRRQHVRTLVSYEPPTIVSWILCTSLLIYWALRLPVSARPRR